jgi:hypothetical protein
MSFRFKGLPGCATGVPLNGDEKMLFEEFGSG